MKKILMTLAVAFVAVAANAQVYVGGNVGIASSKNGDADAVTTYKVLPEIGYNLDQNWAIGTTVGFGKGTPVNIEKKLEDGMLQNYFTVEPYVRYTFVRSKYINAFVDGGFGYAHFNHAHGAAASVNAWSVGVKPGISVNLSPKVSFVAHVGFAGWKSAKADVDGAKSSDAWGVDLDGNNVTFGVYYNF